MFLLMFTERSNRHKEHGYFDIPIFDIEMPNCKTQHINLPQLGSFCFLSEILSVSSDVKIKYCEGSDHKKLTKKKWKLPEEELFKREKELDETLKI